MDNLRRLQSYFSFFLFIITTKMPVVVITTIISMTRRVMNTATETEVKNLDLHGAALYLEMMEKRMLNMIRENKRK